MYVCVLGISGFVILVAMLRTHHFVKSFVLSALQGLTALFAVNFIGDFINVHLPFNWFSAVVGAVGGLPGIIFLLINSIVSIL